VTEVEQPPLLGGRYQLREHIGSGGMADVRRGIDVRLGRDVAVKVLRADLARDPSFQMRFRREAQAAASLNAPSIVSVYDTGEDPRGVPYIVMEHVSGRTLRAVLQSEGRLLPLRALEVTADICAALEVAHRAGIVHRDIKPANVMLTAAGEVKVMDFGIARAAADTSGVTQTAAVVGTAAYLSPEQASGEPVDGRSDVYSTGCLLYELVTGSPPFTGDSPVAVAYQHVREDPEPPSAYDETLPDAVDAVVLKAMAKNPTNRYQSAQEMREDLLRAHAGESVLAPSVLTEPPAPVVTSVVTATAPPHSRRRGIALIAFGLLLAGVLTGAALLARSMAGTAPALVPTPAVVGMEQREAVQALARNGLRVGTLTPTFDARPFGTVIAQRPDAGFVVDTGGRVDLTVSKGVETTVVPVEVVGAVRDEAEVLLRDRKLEVTEVVSRDGLYPVGTVLAVTPAPGTQVAARTGVTLTVATGRVDVPDVVGRSQDEAVRALRDAGFSVRVELRYTDRPAGVVLEQSTGGRTRVAGATVTLVVSQTPPPVPVVEAVEPSPPVEADDAVPSAPPDAPSPAPTAPP